MHSVVDKHESTHRVAILWDSITEPGKIAPTLRKNHNKEEALRFVGFDAWTSDFDMEFSEWFGAPDKTTIRNRMDKGWAEGADKINNISIGEITPTSVKRIRSKGDQGDELDMQAVWMGNLTRAWTRTRRTRRFGTRVLNIMINIGDNCDMKAEDLFWRGGSALRMTEALMEAGYAVSIYAAEAGKNFCEDLENTACGQFVEIKASDAQLDLSQMAAITAMPAWFRSHVFAGICCCADLLGDDVTGGLGRSNHEMDMFADMLGLQGEMIFQPRINNKNDAENWIKDVLLKIEGRHAA